MKGLFQKNVGMMDRCLRFCIGVTLLVLGWCWVHGGWGIAMMVISVPLILSAVFGRCPTYTWLGISTLGKGCCGTAGRGCCCIGSGQLKG